jgi:hypothetical protein
MRRSALQKLQCRPARIGLVESNDFLMLASPLSMASEMQSTASFTHSRSPPRLASRVHAVPSAVAT